MNVPIPATANNPVLRLAAPAKLNLCLRVLGRRADGYHDIETVFERIDFADELTFESRPSGIVLTCDDPTLDCGPTNLVTKAAFLLQQTHHLAAGAAIHLIKRIPIASGLGGGSSDAATTLVGLNQLWDVRLPKELLRVLATQLGSDVPFFLAPEPFAIGRARGEQCEVLTGRLPILWHVLVVPKTRLSTKEVYERAHFDLTAKVSSITMIAHALRNGSLGELAKGFANDLEPEAIRRCPVIATIQSRLRDCGCVGSLVSGSGPSVFGLCQDRHHAEGVAAQLESDGPAEWFIRVVKTCHAGVMGAGSHGDH